MRPLHIPKVCVLMQTRAQQHRRERHAATHKRGQLVLAAEQLRARRIARPSVDRIVRMIGPAREPAHHAPHVLIKSHQHSLHVRGSTRFR